MLGRRAGSSNSNDTTDKPTHTFSPSPPQLETTRTAANKQVKGEGVQ